METLGLRRPQFSEDLAWLPGWVQNQVDQFDECENEYPSCSNFKSKVPTLFRGNIFTGKDVAVSSKEDGRHSSHLLFLSGEDSSPSSFASSSRNVLHFHLHLSSIGLSQGTPSLVEDSEASQAFSKPNRALTNHTSETCVAVKDNSSAKVKIGTGDLNLIHKSNIKQPPNNPANSENSMRHCGEKFSHGHLKDGEIKDAIELSISASEALVIHEVINSRLDSQEQVAADALEVSLQMKQARLEWLEDAFDFSTEIDEADSLSDLDDFAMTDAFEDVGLMCNSDEHHVSDLFLSRVKDTPACENHYKQENVSGSVDLPAQLVNCDDISTQKKSDSSLNSDGTQSKDFGLESLNCERQRKISVNHFLSPSVANLKRDPSTSKDQSAMDMAQAKQINPKMMLKAFTCETSYLSESADIAPDENSLVQIREINSHRESQSSVAVEVLLDKTSNEILFSQDVVRSSSLSLLDPLCSVVPCSLSMEDTNAAEAHKHNNVETDLKRDLRPILECKMENSCKITNIDVEIEHGEEQAMHITNKGSEVSIRKHVTSLKTYSTFFPSSVATSDKGILRYNQSLQPQYGRRQFAFHQSIDCGGTSDKSSSEHLPPFTSTSKCLPGREDEELCKTVLSKNLIEELNKNNASSDDDVVRLGQSEKPQCIRPIYKNCHNKNLQAKKRVRFWEPECQITQNKNVQELNSSGRMCLTMTTSKKIKCSDKSSDYQTCKESLLKWCSNVDKGRVFQGMQFLLTGFSRQKGKDIIGKIQKHGGIILPGIPSPSYIRGSRFSRSNWYHIPIILSTGKQRTAKFLYGCAINTFVLHIDWLTDSIRAGYILSPDKYLILPWQAVLSSAVMDGVHEYNTDGIFEKLGVMLHGKRSFYTKLEKIVKHGGGQVFKTIQRLVQCLNKQRISVGVIVAEDDSMASRHLRQCASEWKIPMMPSSWIVKSLYAGKLLPFTE